LDFAATLSSARLLANVRAQALADRDRWPLWLPVALGTGIGCYFALPVERTWPWAVVAAALVLVAGALSAASERLSWRMGLALLAAASPW
jgi:competence protein ComEC